MSRTAQQRQASQAQTAAVATLLAGSVTAVGVAAGLATTAGVSVATARALLSMPGMRVTSAPRVLGPASRTVAAGEDFYRAAYLVNAAMRVQARVDDGLSIANAVRAELPTMRAHLAAQDNRAKTAVQVDRAAVRHGLTLGWKAVMDERTSAECARANGRNFSVTSRPLIGYPGSVHPHCRCRPVAPFAGAGFVDDVATQAERKVAVA